MSECRFFRFIGGVGCDGCGLSSEDHEGMRVLSRDAGPFGGEDDWLDLTWVEYQEWLDEGAKIKGAREYLADLPDEWTVRLVEVLRGAESR